MMLEHVCMNVIGQAAAAGLQFAMEDNWTRRAHQGMLFQSQIEL